jgi:hypothetical protein
MLLLVLLYEVSQWLAVNSHADFIEAVSSLTSHYNTSTLGSKPVFNPLTNGVFVIINCAMRKKKHAPLLLSVICSVSLVSCCLKTSPDFPDEYSC